MNVVNIVPMTSSPPPSSAPPPHVPVMAGPIADAIAPHAGGVYVDATLGAGGHTLALLMAGAGTVIGFDRDASAVAISRERLARFEQRIHLVHAPFSEIRARLDELGIERVDGLVADLGVSSRQLDGGAYGMSFRHEGPLDMRMDASRGRTALELIEESSDEELTDLIAKLGEERRARRIARCIHQALGAGELETTLDLRRAVVRAVGPARIGGIDPATRTFQALRIAVNDELGEIDRLLDAAPRCLRRGGTVAVLTFHSLEDRIVKRKLAAGSWDLVNKKPLVPSDDEIDDNPRARSAKLRVATLAQPVGPDQSVGPDQRSE
jgi:16S rRNA (cytosine1402-N4)-methyltransferase